MLNYKIQNQQKDNKIANMKKDDQQQDYFEAEHPTEQVQQIKIITTPLLSEANPLYTRKGQQSNSEYDGPITLKILPILQRQDITSYVPFKLSLKGGSTKYDKNNNDEQNKQQQLNQSQLNSARIKKSLLNSAKQNMFFKLYQQSQLIYCKFDNHRHNIFKDVSYFAGLFLPQSILASKCKYLQQQGIPIFSLQNIIKHKKNSVEKIQNSFHQNKQISKPRDKLIFDSKFQCGNLFAVFKTGKYSYDLIVNNDVNSRGSTQWFYFSIQGMEPNVDYKLNIVNFTKRDSLFNYGMKPAIYSVLQNNGVAPHTQKEWNLDKLQQQKCGWYRYAKDVQYYRGEIQRENSNKYYYILAFTINWKLPGDRVFIAHSYPYTNSRINSLMKTIISKFPKNEIQQKNGNAAKKTQQKKIVVQGIRIGKSIGQKQLYAYSIAAKKNRKQKCKEAIIFMARQHPGQTQGSFVCQGIISRFINSNMSKQVKFLLQNYLIYVIPMVNPDGVILGNYRTNLSGKDLNRKWDVQALMPNGLLCPQVIAIKQFLSNLTVNGNVSIRFILDLHGHSKKLNSFFYGNPCPENPQQTKLYPYICSRFSEAIQFMDCTFTTQLYKKKAARIYLSSLYKQLHTYTFESSFYGYNNRQGKTVEYTPLEYMKLGNSLINSLYLLLLKEKKKTQELSQLGLVQEIAILKNSLETYDKFEKQLTENQLLLKVGDAQSSGSQSKPQQGQLNNEDIFYESQEEQNDQRVLINGKSLVRSEVETQNQRQMQISFKSNKQKQISKTKSIRINNRKSIQQNTIEYKEKGRHFKNKKLITLSQVNAVLPDKYHISLLPIQRMANKTGKKVDMESQTQIGRQEKIAIKQYKLFQIQQRGNLVGNMGDQANDQGGSVCSMFAQKKIVQPKKHSQIVAQIQKNSRHQIYRQSSQIQKDLINKRKISHISNLKSLPPRNDRINKKKQKYTQTIATFKNSYSQKRQPNSIKILQSPNRNSVMSKINENESRIAKMEKINQQVLRIYSKKSAIVDINLKYQGEKVQQKQN